MRSIVLLLIFCQFLFTAFSQQWKIGTDYKVAFSSSDVSGIFKDLSGSINFDPKSLTTSKFDLEISVESISTGNGMMNGHAKGEEWFDAVKYPKISFLSNKIEKTNSGYVAIGKLQIKGVKKEVSVPFSFVQKGNKATIVAKFSIDRTHYGVGKKGNDVSETMNITTTIPVTKK